VAEIDTDYRITGFEEKPRHGNPKPSVFNPEMISASMGIYVFRPEVLRELLLRDAEDAASSHDFGKDVLPKSHS
jgi:glucose-1-phosphate adenylyltransferase